MKSKLIFTAGVALFASLLSAGAQFTNRSSVLDGSGTISSGGGYTNISAAGQPGGIAVSTGGSYVNQAGFLNTFSLKPSLDSDGDGLADEIDMDNDHDQLADATELAGSAFSPITPTLINLADTDGDGIADSAEAVAGSNPTDPNSLLEIVAITNAAGSRFITWQARGGNQKTYIVRGANTAFGPYTTVVFSNTVAGGSAPWFDAIGNAGDPAAATNRFFAIEVLP